MRLLDDYAKLVSLQEAVIDDFSRMVILNPDARDAENCNLNTFGFGRLYGSHTASYFRISRSLVSVENDQSGGSLFMTIASVLYTLNIHPVLGLDGKAMDLFIGVNNAMEHR